MGWLRWPRLMALALAALVALSLPGCTAGTQDEGEDSVTNDTETITNDTGLDGFYAMIMQSDLAQEAHPLSDVTKVLCYESKDTLGLYTFAIDIAGKGMFIEPSLSLSLDYDEPDYHMTDADVEEVLAILERNDVLAWDPVYGDMTDPGEGAQDGWGGWFLYIQYSDNTVSYFCGTGSMYEGGHPDTYGSFIKELTDFVDSKK